MYAIRSYYEAYKQLTALMTRLEKHYKDMQDMEFSYNFV